MCIRNSGEAYVRLGGFNYSAVILPASGLGSLLWLLVVINIYSSPRVRNSMPKFLQRKLGKDWSQHVKRKITVSYLAKHANLMA